ncbi:MAG: hypothetical protein R3C53_19320 [Pirellulaceae bacterium]
MTLFILALALITQTNAENPDWEQLLSDCMSGKVVIDKVARSQIVDRLSLEDGLDTRTAKLACVYFSTARAGKSSYDNNTPSTLFKLLELARLPQLSSEELGLIGQIVCLSIDSSTTGNTFERQIWQFIDQLPIEKRASIIASFRLASWEEVHERVERMNAAFIGEKSTDEIREAIILAVGGALVENRLEIRQCLSVFSDLHQLKECTDKNDHQMMDLLSEFIETERARTKNATSERSR